MAVATLSKAEPDRLTKAEKWLRGFLWFICAESVVFVGVYLSGGLFDGEEFRFVTNSTVKDFLFAMLAGLAATDVRRYLWAAWFVLIGHVALIVVNGVLLIFTDQADVRMLGAEIPATTLMVAWMAVDAVIVAALYLLMRAAQRERFGLRYLGPAEFATLRALAEVLIDGPDEKVTPTEIAQNVDRYLSRLDARGKGVVKLSYIGLTLFPLLFLKAPFAAMRPRDRKAFVEKRFLRAVAKRKIPIPLLRNAVQGMIRAAQQFVFLGYYGDKRSYADVGYRPFSERERPPGEIERHEVETSTPEEVGEADVVVIGSGAAGAILAYRLAEKGRSVVVLERGPHIRSRDISEDEVAMYLALYNEGALQLARDFRFTVLQGMAIGGSTLINNAVCFRAPERVQQDWNDRWSAGLDLDGLSDSYARVEKWFDVQQADPSTVTPGSKVFVEGVDRLGLGEAKLVDVNISKCLGCGYCNIGCEFDRKKSTLVHVLPAAQKRFPGRVRVIADCRVDAIEADDRVARGVICDVGGTQHRIKAKDVVVSAGAVNSSVLLLNSGLKRSLAGERLHFNIVTPLTADAGYKIDSYDGLQISHYWDAAEHGNGNGSRDRYILETWFNPPATHSLVMPGWFGQHYDNMRRYDHMVAAGVVVGTTTPGRVKPKKTGPDISYKPSREDLDQVIAGMKEATRILLAGGAERVMPQTYLLHELRSEADLSVLDQYATHNEGLGLNSAHPQGGNPISSDWRTGVVDPSFRVHGMDNVYVCDASVFPTSVTVNPQLTVMALADYASERIA
jgi:choline dehydrogenase-like flavoprotein